MRCVVIGSEPRGGRDLQGETPISTSDISWEDEDDDEEDEVMTRLKEPTSQDEENDNIHKQAVNRVKPKCSSFKGIFL